MIQCRNFNPRHRLARTTLLFHDNIIVGGSLRSGPKFENPAFFPSKD